MLKLVRAGSCVAALFLLWCATSPAWSGPAQDARTQQRHAAAEAARKALVAEPSSIDLGNEAKLALPEHFGFIPHAQAAALMRALGNRAGDDFLGLIVPTGEQAAWFVTVRYAAAGYIKDDDAKHWDADKLLQSLKDGTEAANADRELAGIPPIAVTRWVEVPKYEGDTHRLVWSAEVRQKQGADPDPTINYNTYVLGREGYMSLDLITSAKSVDQDKAAAHQLLAAVNFNPGRRYGDFNSSTDKVAAYGLGALIAGVAAKKLGLLALLAAGAVKFAKVIALAVAGAIAVVTKWVKGRTSRETPAP